MLGDELRKARQSAGLTQERVALDVGMDRSYLSEIENDKKSPTVDMLFKICDEIGIRASELLSRVERRR